MPIENSDRAEVPAVVRVRVLKMVVAKGTRPGRPRRSAQVRGADVSLHEWIVLGRSIVLWRVDRPRRHAVDHRSPLIVPA